jgi:pyruvate formate lyase activating enzyme
MIKEADFYLRLENSCIQCTLCPHSCRLSPGEFGVCGVRRNHDGMLFTHVYESAAALQVDPIEKKPLFHVYPGSKSFSIATVGCNFSCTFCQNHHLSQITKNGRIDGKDVPAAQVVQLARENGCKTIACTYTEPTIFFEYAYDIARIAAEQNILTVFVTNGYINPAPLKKIAPFLAAANVDLKGWSSDFYREVCGGELKHVLATLKLMKKLNILVEVTTLAVTGYVEDDQTLQDIAHFIFNELGPETPWHISRFFPNYHYAQVAPTPLEVIYRARDIGMAEGLRYVYCGNLHGDEGESTFCHACGERLIHRRGYQIIANIVKDDRCPKCGTKVYGIGMGNIN